MQFSRLLTTLLLNSLTVIAICGVVDCRIGKAEEPRSVRLHDMLVINEDNSHFFGYKKPAEMNVRGLQAWVDQYAGGAVTHLFLCPNAMRASFRSKSRDATRASASGPP